MPLTLTCPAKEIGNSGTGGEGGVVMQGPVMLLWQSKGWPIDFTRNVIEGGTKFAIRQGVGPGPAGGGIDIAQPTIANGADEMGTGVPMIFTRGFGVVGLAWPPWAHVTTQFMFNKNPGIRLSPEPHCLY